MHARTSFLQIRVGWGTVLRVCAWVEMVFGLAEEKEYAYQWIWCFVHGRLVCSHGAGWKGMFDLMLDHGQHDDVHEYGYDSDAGRGRKL